MQNILFCKYDWDCLCDAELDHKQVRFTHTGINIKANKATELWDHVVNPRFLHNLDEKEEKKKVGFVLAEKRHNCCLDVVQHVRTL